MRISKIDRYMAISRHPEYLKEYEKYAKSAYGLAKIIIKNYKQDPSTCFNNLSIDKATVESLDNDQIQHIVDKCKVALFYHTLGDILDGEQYEHEIMSRWNIDVVIAPYSAYNDIVKLGSIIYEKAVEIVDSISTEYPPFTFTQKRRPPSSFYEKLYATHDPAKRARINKEYFEPTSQYLYLRIDLSQEPDDIYDAIEHFITYTQEHFQPIVRTRDNEFKYDFFKVYDMHVRDGLNLSEIGRRLSGSTGCATENEDVKRADSAVRRSYERAKLIMATIDKQLIKS